MIKLLVVLLVGIAIGRVVPDQWVAAIVTLAAMVLAASWLRKHKL